MDGTDDDAAMQRYGQQLAEAAGPACQRWLDRVVAVVPTDRRDAVVEAAILAARSSIEEEVVAPLRSLLATDVDEQRTNPLAVLRRLAPIGATVLDAAGALREVELPVSRERSHLDHETWVVHRSRLGELSAWLAAKGPAAIG